MGKNQSASGLTNVIQYNNGNITFVSGSTTLMSISSSGAITTTGVISGSNVLTASYANNAELLDGLDSTAFATTGAYSATSGSLYTVSSSAYATSGSLSTASGSFNTRVSALEATGSALSSSILSVSSSAYATSGSLSATSGSLSAASGSFNTRVSALEVTGSALSSSILSVSSSAYATSGSLSAASGSFNSRVASLETYSTNLTAKTASFATTGSNTFIGSQVVSGSLTASGSITATGTITAQTLVVQTITSSVVYSSGSNVFGNDIGNSQRFTGSVLITGSLTIAGASSATSYSGTTIYGSTVVCSPVGKFTSCIDAGSGTFSSSVDVKNTVAGDTTSISRVSNINYGLTMLLTGDSYNTNTGLFDIPTTGNSNYPVIYSNSNKTLYFGTYSNQDIKIGTNNIVRLTIASTGAATISAPTTDYAFTVNGTALWYTARFIGSATTGQSYGPLITAGTNSSDQSFIVQNKAASSNYFVVRGDGNVGIGTGSPNFKTHISTGSDTSITQPTAGTYGLYIQQNSSGNVGGLYIQDGASNSGNSIFVGDNNGVARFVVNTDGNVLVGSSSNDFGKLDITVAPSSYTAALGLGLQTNSGEGNSVGISFKTKVSLSGVIWENARIAAFTDAVSSSAYGALAFYTMSATTLCERMRIGNNGYIGIGIASPGAKLHVDGTIFSTTRSNTIDTDDGVSNNFQGYGGYWALRTDNSNRFNLDVYNSGTPITALQLSLAGESTFSKSITATGLSLSCSTGLQKIGASRLFTANTTTYYDTTINQAGMLITNSSNDRAGVFVVSAPGGGNSAISEIGDPSSYYSTTCNNANTVNFFFSGGSGNLIMQNCSGATRDFSLTYVGTS